MTRSIPLGCLVDDEALAGEEGTYARAYRDLRVYDQGSDHVLLSLLTSRRRPGSDGNPGAVRRSQRSLRVEIEDPDLVRVLDEFRSRPDAELLLDPGAMCLDRAKAHAADACDLCIGVAEGEQPQNLLFLRREPECRVARPVPARELDAQRGLQVGLTVGDGSYPHDELGGCGGPQQIAVGAGGKHGLDLRGMSDRREHEDRALGKGPSESADHLAMRRVRKLDIRHNDVRRHIERSGISDALSSRDDDEIRVLL